MVSTAASEEGELIPNPRRSASLMTAKAGEDSSNGVHIEDPVMEAKKLNLWYDKNQALKDIDVRIPGNRVTALIGPSGCGKSTLIRTFNRMNDVIPKVRIEGRLLYKGQDVYGKKIDVQDLRTKIGMIFQKPNPFPKSIYDNIAYGPRIHGERKKARLDAVAAAEILQAFLEEKRKP